VVKDQFDLGHLPSPRPAGNGNGHSHPDPVAGLRLLVSDLQGRANLAGVAGLTFGGRRDLYSALGYARVLTVRDHRDRYNRGDISSRIVDAYPKATWSGGAEVVEDEDPTTETQFEADWKSIEHRLQPWTMLLRADVLAGLGPFAVILIGATGKTETPLPMMSGPDDVLYLAPYGPEEITVNVWDENPESSRYGLPVEYTIQRTARTNSGRSPRLASFRVHWTRIVHVADGVLDDRTNGTPRLEKIWNRLDDLDKVVGGGSEAFWLRVHQGYHWDMAPDVKITEPQVEKLKEEAEDFANQLRRTIATRGIKLDVKGSDVSPFNNQVISLMSIISGATGIPQRILLGSERGELASTQDKENWNERVTARRDEYGEPLVRQLVDRLVDHGALDGPTDYEVRWPEIAGLSQTDQAQVASVWAGLNASAGGTVVTPGEIRDRVLGLQTLAEVEADKTISLNGAQVAAATEIVRSVARGELPRDSGVVQIEALFGVPHDLAEQIVGSAGKEKPKPEPELIVVPPVVESEL
jgi:hypothetical protein